MAGPSAAPKLPNNKKANKKKVAATSKDLPIFEAQMITLEDGTQVPIKIPPHMGAEQGAAVVEFLRSNPAAARAMYDQAQSILTTSPGLAKALVNMPVGTNAPPSETAMAHFEALKDDPDMKEMMEDVKANGPSALQKYWDDKDLMTKISEKLKAANLGPPESPEQAAAMNNAAAPPTDLHDAAKKGDVEAGRRMIEEGADVNSKNDRGITPLGTAVGFNRVEFVQLLIEKGVDLMQRDAKGNAALHYAAGYGRRQVVEILLAAGADLAAVNSDKQTALDVAKLNKETGIIKFLSEHPSTTNVNNN